MLFKVKYNIYTIILMVTLVSFLGFLVENVWLAMTKGYVDNRNMYFPFLLGYGFAILSLYYILGTPKDATYLKRLPFLDTPFKMVMFYWLCAFCFVCIAEVLLGTFIERTCQVVLWNYSRFTLHITKYTSVPTSTAFAFIITFYMDRCFTPIMQALSNIDYDTAKSVSLIFLVIMVSDFTYNAYRMYTHKDFNRVWKFDLKRHKYYRLTKQD